MGRLTTHVLDQAHGIPARGVAVELWSAGEIPHLLGRAVTNADGRLDVPLLGGVLPTGSFELRFAAAAYWRGQGIDPGPTPFLDIVVIRFGIGDPNAHLHVPLLLSPYGYATYRGS